MKTNNFIENKKILVFVEDRTRELKDLINDELEENIQDVNIDYAYDGDKLSTECIKAMNITADKIFNISCDICNELCKLTLESKNNEKPRL